MYAGRGCEACHHTGYKGCSGIFELLRVDPRLQNLIARAPPPWNCTATHVRSAREGGWRARWARWPPARRRSRN